jgi:hypothetical protein
VVMIKEKIKNTKKLYLYSYSGVLKTNHMIYLGMLFVHLIQDWVCC